MMEEFFAANKIVVLRGLLCSDAILQNDYTSLIESLKNESWEKENEVFNFSFYAWKGNFLPDLSTIVFFDEHNNINRAIHCYESHNTLREYLRN
jgi:hypothetical protein